MARRSLLLMEETEWIRTGNRIYARYLDIVEAMLAAQSNTLYVGPLLARLKSPASLRRRESRV